MKRTISFMSAISFLFAASVFVAAQSDPTAGLFVISAPIRAEAIVDGTPAGTTPLLARDLAPGEHSVELIKPGYVRMTLTANLGEGETGEIRVTLEPNLFAAAFAAPETIVAGVPYSRQDARFLLPAGTYEFSRTGASLTLDPVYPNESALRALRVAMPVVVVAAAISTIEDMFVQDSSRSYFTSFFPSPGTFAAWTAAAASTGFLAALSRDKARYEAETVVREYAGALTEAEAERMFGQAEQALETGNLGSALTSYSRVFADGGDSEYVPPALYKAARIYGISGDSETALALFELLVRDYPVPETYDRALKSISNIELGREHYARAVAALKRMVFVDDLYDRAEVASDIAEIRALGAGGEETP